jgi:hypothetical protein
MTLAKIITSQIITVTFDSGITRQVRRDSSMFDRVVDLIKNGASDNLLQAAMDLAQSIKRHASGLFDVTDAGVVSVAGEALPDSLSKRIITFANEGFDFAPLLKFWDNCKKNPDPRAKTDLYAFLEHNGIPITSDGCFVGYRAVRNDWLDKHTGTMMNTVGAVLTMDRALCDSDPNQTCSRGLHVAAYNYARHNFGSGDDRLINVKVNPADVVAIPVDYNGEKMRVCKFEVMAENQEGIINRPVYDPQNVAALGGDWEDEDGDEDGDEDSQMFSGIGESDESGAVSSAGGNSGGANGDGWKSQPRLSNGRFARKV